MGLLPSSMRRLLCCCQAGIAPLVAMVLPLLMCRGLCRPGIFAIITITLLPLLQWCCCCVNLVSLPLSRWHHCHCWYAGVFALVMMAFLPLLRCCYCQHCMGDIILVALVSLSLSRWPLCPHVPWVPSPLLHRRCCPRQAGVFAPWSVGIIRNPDSADCNHQISTLMITKAISTS